MPLAKLTLSVDKEVISWAREISKEEKTSISSIFSRYVRARKYPEKKKIKPGPLTRTALNIGKEASKKLPPDFDYKEVLTEALMGKYGLKK